MSKTGPNGLKCEDPLIFDISPINTLSLSVMEKSKLAKPEQRPPFMTPEMMAALQLIQLSGDADVDIHSHELHDSTGDVRTTTNRRRRKEVGDDGESEGSSTSDMTSAMRFLTPLFHDDDEADDVAGSRRKRKKLRSVVEIYEISNY